MAGTIVADTVQNGAGANTSMTNVVSGACVAWVNFTGVTTTSIRASYNISSVTYVSTGNYTVNFTTALSDANYAILATTSGQYGTAWLTINPNITGAGATEVVPTAASFALETVQPSTARADSKYVYVAIHR